MVAFSITKKIVRKKFFFLFLFFLPPPPHTLEPENLRFDRNRVCVWGGIRGTESSSLKEHEKFTDVAEQDASVT